MHFQSDSYLWAERVFGSCQLGDPRRRVRLLDLASRLASEPSGSICKICGNDGAAREGAYKLIENSAVRPEDISASVFESTAQVCPKNELVLALQDTTAITPSNRVAEALKEAGAPAGFHVHSTLLVNGQTKTPIGLLDQSYWLRKPKSDRPGRHTRKSRHFEDKESYKWASGFENTRQRLKSMSNVVTVCDREADVFEHLHLMLQAGCRFVVRLARDRALENQQGYLFEAIREFPVLGQRDVQIAQRGAQMAKSSQSSRRARAARVAHTNVSAGTVELKVPRDTKSTGLNPLTLNVVHVWEKKPQEDEEPISWMLLTTEPVATLEDAEKVIDMYSARWVIEEFHKSWKSGCNIEERPLQTLENIERMMAITAPVAVRILQLRQLGIEKPEESCELVLATDEWRCLWTIVEKTKYPKMPPNVRWAYLSIAKLAGWSDSKRTGRAGWQTLWLGWEKLQQQLIGWRAAFERFSMDR